MRKSVTNLSIVISSVLCISLTACSRHDDVTHPIVRLDRVLADFSAYSYSRQMEEVDSLRPEMDAMFSVLGIDDVDIPMLEAWSQSQVVEVFQPAVDSVYPDINNVEKQLAYIMDRANADSLNLPDLRFATVTWGNPRPIVRVDTVVLIALNHYLGADYHGYERWQQYRRADKTPSRLPYDLAAALVATQYPMQIDAQTCLLNWMLYEGALVEARMRLVKDADIADALGYTPEQYQCVESNCRNIWEEMAVRRLIYDTDPVTIDRYIAPAPNTPLLQSSAPGRIGRYIGYKIVKSYMKSHPDADIAYLLSPQFYGSQQSLIDSGFNPS